MTGKIHLSLGTYIGISGSLLSGLTLLPATAFTVGTMIGSLFPDIDSPKSMISQKIFLLPTIINKLLGHRGFFHTPCCLALFYLLLSRFTFYGILQYLSIGFLTGYLSHLTQDVFTKGGLSLLYPFTKKKFRLGVFRSGSSIDPVITTVLGCIWTYLLLSNHGYILF